MLLVRTAEPPGYEPGTADTYLRSLKLEGATLSKYSAKGWPLVQVKVRPKEENSAGLGKKVQGLGITIIQFWQ
jgi:hypothetical protein